MYNNLGKFGYNPGWIVTAIVCGLWGLSFAFLPRLPANPTIFWIGSLVCGALFIAFLVVPFILWLTRNNTARA